LPPAAYFEPGIGFRYRGGFGVDVDFGLGYDDFVFVGYDHFWDHDYRPFLAPVGVRIGLFRSSLVINDYSFGVDGRFVVGGLGRDHIALVTHHDIRPVDIVIRDPRIMHAREVQRDFVVHRVEEIKARPANDPMRRAMETHDVETKDHLLNPGRATTDRGVPERGVPGRGVPDVRGTGRGTLDTGTRGPPSRDGKDNQGGPGGGPGSH
jgi:hypothetical protein